MNSAALTQLYGGYVGAENCAKCTVEKLTNKTAGWSQANSNNDGGRSARENVSFDEDDKRQKKTNRSIAKQKISNSLRRNAGKDDERGGRKGYDQKLQWAPQKRGKEILIGPFGSARWSQRKEQPFGSTTGGIVLAGCTLCEEKRVICQRSCVLTRNCETIHQETHKDPGEEGNECWTD
ncbi:hypothetical protein K438DRAFT_1779462 [Mycena galopus ATCC 62051]|nr:hypothetical protein K438DRAFT_1779462 [Mycena galopus ATCC 62051]